MTTDKDRDDERAARFLEDLVAEDEVERLLGLSDDELIAEMKREGRDLSQLPSTEALLARVKDRAAAEGRLVPEEVERSGRLLRFGRRWRVPGVLAAAAAVAAVVGGTVMHEEGLVGSMPNGHAADLRREALERCGAAAWKDCQRLLDEAARVNPAGEDKPSIKKAREEIAKAGQPR